MAAASLSSAFSRRLFRNPNRPHSFIPLIRNPSRRISCSVPHKPFGWIPPFLLQPDRKIKTLIKSGQTTMEQQHETSLEKIQRLLFDADHHTPAPAIVKCITTKDTLYYDSEDDTLYADDDEADNTILHFSTFNSAGALLNKFSKSLIGEKNHGHNPFMKSARRNLVLLQDQDTFVCNISTQELTDLPDVNGGRGSCDIIGFGYVPSTKEFKALADLSYLKLGFTVLTLGAYRWRDAKHPPFDINHCGRGCGAFVNGAIHFVSKHRDRIAAFNLEREEWGSIAAPPILANYSLTEFNDKYLCALNKTTRSSIDIWLLDYNNDGSWGKQCTISFSVWNNLYSVEPLAIENDGRILVLVNDSSLQLYDPKAKSSREIHSFNITEHWRGTYFKVFSSALGASVTDSIQFGA